MSEFDEWWKRTRKFFEDIDRLFDELIRESLGEERRRRVFGPYYYGFRVTIGPDGVPKVEEWGNVRPGPIRPRISEAIEPFTDTIEEEDVIRIVADIPGVEKEKIDIEATEDTVVISASNEDRRYYKEVRLPAPVKPETAKATYRNGVLTITIEKKEKIKRRGFRIKID
ncbi:MAG: Hsp20/alpha crystallin family protein [Thermoprotei archaeon]|nr:MAG: Hsp20/alpha crystallin family protein [Thermoprotei archaeon]